MLTDPGSYTSDDRTVLALKNIHAILITHEHGDHLHIETLKKVLQNNPEARVITVAAVGKILEGESVHHEILEDKQESSVGGVSIEAFGAKHALLHSSIPAIQNTGYFISNRFFYPGDALTDPGKAVEILALPVAGPWLKISEAVDYALNLKPKIAIPVHDGTMVGGNHFVPSTVLPKNKIEFKVPELGEVMDL